MTFSDRGKEVLKIVVEGYIETGEPVGSRTVAKRCSLNLSPATIRNVMADLEEMGYLFQPHVSAGRIPTEKGLRFFIDVLLEPEELSPLQRAQIERLYEEPGGDLAALMKRACRLVAAFSHYPGLVMLPPLRETVFKRIEFVRLRPKQILVLFVSSSGMVQTRVVELDEDLPEGELRRMAEYLNEMLTGLPLREVRERLMAEVERERKAYDDLRARALKIGGRSLMLVEGDREVYIEGQTQILEEPEFSSDARRMRQLLEALDRKGRLLEILDKAIKFKEEGVQVLIGSESRIEGLEMCSLVLSPYGLQDHALGILGVIGPLRMAYSRVVPLVDYTAKVLSHVIETYWRGAL